ncbi:MAG: glycoside hydrolase domain-containing protein, partial [Verrucomicrobiota bacterium]
MSPLRHLLMPALIASTAPMLAAAAPDPGASLPTAVTTRLDSAAAMTKMETAVKPEVLDAFKQQHPAPFWLFGEDRQLAIRNAIIPAHWFDEGARQFQQFCGVARPGEFYVFQVGLVPGAKTPKIACDVAFKSLPGAVARIVAPESAGSGLNPVGAVVPIWASVQIPANAPLGVYHGEVTFHDPRPPQGEA